MREAILKGRSLPKAYIHMGLPKTGTTAIQYALRDHGPLLQKHGLFHPETPFSNAAALVALFHPKGSGHFFITRKGYTEAQVTQIKEDFHTQVTQSTTDIVVSSEYLYNLGHHAGRVADYFASAGFEPVFIFYIRHPVDLAVSAAQQSVKMGSKSLDALIENPHWSRIRSSIEPLQKAGLTVCVRNYGDMKNRNVIDDFISLLGHEELAGQLPVKRSNEGLTMDGVLLADIYKKNQDAKQPKPFNKYAIFNVGGSRFTLPESAKEIVREQSRDEVAWVEQTFGIQLQETGHADKFRWELTKTAQLIMKAHASPVLNHAPEGWLDSMKRLLRARLKIERL
ncbi:hypothetical protein [Thioclava kandeliae]|uniref:Sulfotransferase n=1 Tax=Thioclava kandeliae TaxID=3070818 RepID=A0ABV1SM79_9RHOB